MKLRYWAAVGVTIGALTWGMRDKVMQGIDYINQHDLVFKYEPPKPPSAEEMARAYLIKRHLPVNQDTVAMCEAFNNFGGDNLEFLIKIYVDQRDMPVISRFGHRGFKMYEIMELANCGYVTKDYPEYYDQLARYGFTQSDFFDVATNHENIGHIVPIAVNYLKRGASPAHVKSLFYHRACGFHEGDAIYDYDIQLIENDIATKQKTGQKNFN